VALKLIALAAFAKSFVNIFGLRVRLGSAKSRSTSVNFEQFVDGFVSEIIEKVRIARKVLTV
jgi:hypothetical protein